MSDTKEKLETVFVLSKVYDPFDLLRLSKDAFYEVIEEEVSQNNDNIDVTVNEAELEFVVVPDNYVPHVCIQVKLIDYTIN